MIPDVWFCSPTSAEELVKLANWARRFRYHLRPYGSGHGFAPTLLPRGSSPTKMILVNTSEALNSISVDANGEVKTVTAQAGASLESICIACAEQGLGFYHTTAPGDVSIAGVLAMNAHGAALPASGETLQPGHSWGSMSNLVLALKAVVWSETQHAYVLKTFQRDDPAIGPLLTCLARIFIVEVTLQLGPDLKIRCQSRTDLTVEELLASPDNQNEFSFSNLSDQLGTVDVLFYPFAPDGNAWVKTWTVTPTKPDSAREVTAPYNYQTTSVDPDIADQISAQLRNNEGAWVPDYNELSTQGIEAVIGNTDPATQVFDIWGSAYTTTLYVKPLTPRNTVAAWGVIVARSDMQRALSDFYSYFVSLVESFAAQGLYPYTGPIELRAHGVDKPAEVLVTNAVEPTLSGARPHPLYPDKEVIIWFAINNNVDQPHAAAFNTQLEDWFLSHFQDYAVVRPEWTKSYAFTQDGAYGGAWTNDTILRETFPNTWRTGYASDADWDYAAATFNELDPHRIFSNSFLDKLFPA